MSVEIHIIDGPIRAHAAATSHDGAGATVVFDGIVRGIEDGQSLAALSYEHYEPMASEQLRALAEDILHKHTLLALHCHHSRGRVNIGECSMRVIIHSAHRKEALAAMGEFIDRLKRDVPIWKSVIWA